MKGLLFTYILTGTGSTLALFNPFYGLLAFLALAIVKPEAMWPWAVTSGRFSLILAMAMLVGWSYSRRAHFRFGQGRGPLLLLFGYLAWACFLAVMAENGTEAWKFVETLLKIAVPFLIGLTTIDSTARLKQLAWTIVLAQGYAALEFNRTYFGGYNQLAEEGFGTLDNNSAAIGLVTALGIAVYMGLSTKPWWAKCVAFFLAAMMAHAILFSYSRGGMLAMMIAAAVGFITLKKRVWHYAAFGLALTLAVSQASPEIRERFMSSFANKQGEREASAQSRVDLWRNCWDIMKKEPVFGCGPNHFPLNAPKYGWPLGKEAHGLWMQTGAEMGFPGLALFAGFYLLTMFRMWQLMWKRTPVIDEWHRTAARMVITSLTGFVVSAQFVSLESMEMPYFVVLIGAGLLKLNTRRTPWEDTEFQNAMSNDIPHPTLQVTNPKTLATA